MPGDRSDDELARTATAPGSASAEPAPAPELGATLGRYRLERALGEGGMGVVHAAFDPDLERRVALKVLRVAEGAGEEARQRLLREARAMARLTHPNVVTVHEVGTAGGRDYVAMELIDGETLAEWLRAAPRSRHEIVAAFLASGRGLAAAHAAGLVHRDFKPHNVLRRQDGRVCVTDFGLARGVEAAIELEVTLRAHGNGKAKAENTPTPLSGLTATGSVLGTPAYMAPEQWSGGTVGPAADQFAFCVALWEALAGERPFRGATLDALKAEVARGPRDLDASKVPRRLRGVLRRGLDPDPAKRWPNMDALLAALARAERRPAVASTVAGFAVVAAAVAFVALRGHSAPAAGPSCEPPARSLEAVWPASAGPALAASGRADLRDVFQKDLDAWRSERDRACAAPPAQRPAQLACLDGVLARLDTVRQAVARVPGELPADAVLALLVQPSVCAEAAPPHLTITPTPEMVDAFALALRDLRGDDRPKADELAAFAARPGLGACARGYALYAQLDVEDDVPKDRAIASDGLAAVEACGDERLRADFLLLAAPLDYEQPAIGPRGLAALAKAKGAVDRVAQPDLVAAIDEARAEVLSQQHRWDEALAAAERGIAELGARGRVREQIRAVQVENDVHLARGEVADLHAIADAVHKWKPVARAHHWDKLVRSLEIKEGESMLFLGGVLGAHAAILQAYHPVDSPGVPTQRIDGVVVDTAGHPVTGAIVAAGTEVWAESIGPLPFGNGNDLRFATSGTDGTFTIPDAPMQGAMLAQLGPRRGMAVLAPHVRLVVAPTRTISGKVDLRGIPRPKVFVMVIPIAAGIRANRFFAPLQPDSSFEMQAVPPGPAIIGVATWGTDVSTDVSFQKLAPAGDVHDLQLAAMASGRTLVVVARSSIASSLDGAQVFLLDGRRQYKKVSELFHKSGVPSALTEGHMQMRMARPIVGEQVPQAAMGKTQPGDLIATFTGVHDGEVSACVIGMTGDLTDPSVWRKMNAHVDELELRCETAGPDDHVVVVEAPPQKRFD